MTTGPEPRRDRLRDALVMVALTAAYAAAGKLCLEFAVSHASTSAVWAPSGIAVGALLAVGIRFWPAILVGAFVVNITTPGMHDVLAVRAAISSGIAAGNTLEAIAGAWLVSHLGAGTRSFERAGDVFRFAGLAASAANAISATIGVSTLVIGGAAEASNYALLWLTWWVGDLGGVLVVAPPIVCFANQPRLRGTPLATSGAAWVFASVAALGILVFWDPVLPANTHYPIGFIALPALFWAAFRLGARETALANFLLGMLALTGTARDIGPFALGIRHETFLMLAAYLAVMSIMSLAVAASVEERRRADADREKLLASAEAAREEAERANRLKDDFIATISHELRTPVHAIQGWAHLLREGKLDDSGAAEAAEIIERNSALQARIIRDLLDMTRIIAGSFPIERRELALQDVATAAFDGVRLAASDERLVLRDWEASVRWRVEAEEVRLEQVFRNLLGNAIKFTEAGGTITFTVRSAGPLVEAEVHDTGKGIPSEFMPFIFEPYRQEDPRTSRQHGGLGLGLAITKRIIDLHQGLIRAESAGPGKGATFTVALTRLRAPGEGDPESGVTYAGDEDAILAGKVVLVIDDEPDSLALVERILADSGASVQRAKSASEGLAILQSARPDIIVSDLAMPGMDGYELIRRIRQLAPDAGGETPAIALTALAGAEGRRKAVESGFQCILTKPGSAEQLVAAVAALTEA
jgi:signal transduction histidine kinase/ActR/RegA family two-component response regulator